MLLERLLSSGSLRPQDSMRFVLAGSNDEPLTPQLSVPETWSLEAAQAFAPALCLNAPEKTETIEENTMPSWLWHRRKSSSSNKLKPEISILDVFNRIAGSTCYNGWKQGLFSNEISASVFYDELVAALVTRRLMLEPKDMARIGIDWAYDLPKPAKAVSAPKAMATDMLVLQNETIDGLLQKTAPHAQSKWQRFLDQSLGKEATRVAFADTINQWGGLVEENGSPKVSINLSAFRTIEGDVDVAALEHTAKIATITLELLYDVCSTAKDQTSRPISILLAGMPEILMGLGLAYDSEKARTTAACLTAIVTSTATLTSAKIAGVLGPCVSYASRHELTLRTLRNRLRATFGEANDYEHLAVVPPGIDVESGADLVLISKARYCAHEALRLAQAHGLRHMHFTGFAVSHDIAQIFNCDAGEFSPLKSLTCDYAAGAELFVRTCRSCVFGALEKLEYSEEDIEAIKSHIEGYSTLKGSPAINQSILRDKGFDDSTLQKIEDLLPFANHLSDVFTPWVLGHDFVQQRLGLNLDTLNHEGSGLLSALGFSSKEIAVANAFCCGHRSIRGVSEILEKDVSVFDTTDSLPIQAIMKMAASVQPFISSEVQACLKIPAALSASLRGELLLQAWQLGLRSIRLERTETSFKADEAPLIKRKTQSLSSRGPVTQHSALASRAIKPKAPAHSLSLRTGKAQEMPRTKRGS